MTRYSLEYASKQPLTASLEEPRPLLTLPGPTGYRMKVKVTPARQS